MQTALCVGKEHSFDFMSVIFKSKLRRFKLLDNFISLENRFSSFFNQWFYRKGGERYKILVIAGESPTFSAYKWEGYASNISSILSDSPQLGSGTAMIGPSLQLTGLVLLLKKNKTVDTQLVPSGGFGRLFLKSQVVKIADFAGRIISVPRGRCTMKAVLNNQSTDGYVW